ncbi:MAG: GerMN domain-containing protein [Actinomycetota bacterium]|nr:GerMN domain-containing protein [Actinomycetota bacterium]MDA3019962.1 GerMN domain-containing protein [Actinomycetota bacterium]
MSLFFVGCSIPGSGEVTSIDANKIPYELNATTTSSPPTTVPATTTTSPVIETTTTISSTIPVELVSLFFVAGTQVVPIDRPLLSPAAPPQVLAALAEGPPEGDAAAGLRSALPIDFAAQVTLERGIATVVLPATFITDLPGSEQRLAIAQIVLTLTQQSGVGQVRFTSNNEPQTVPRGRGDLSSPGATVACDDYANLLPSNFSC